MFESKIFIIINLRKRAFYYQLILINENMENTNYLFIFKPVQ